MRGINSNEALAVFGVALTRNNQTFHRLTFGRRHSGIQNFDLKANRSTVIVGVATSKKSVSVAPRSSTEHQTVTYLLISFIFSATINL